MGDGMGMGWGIVMVVAMLALVAAVIVGVTWLVVQLIRDRERSGGGRERRSTLDRGP